MKNNYVNALREAAEFLEEKGISSKEILSIRIDNHNLAMKVKVSIHLSGIRAMKKTGAEITYKKPTSCDCYENNFWYEAELGDFNFTIIENKKLTKKQLQYKDITV